MGLYRASKTVSREKQMRTRWAKRLKWLRSQHEHFQERAQYYAAALVRAEQHLAEWDERVYVGDN